MLDRLAHAPSGVGLAPQALRHLEPAAVRETGGGGLLHDDHHVAPVPPAVAELADVDAAEQPERVQAPARLRHRREAERLALLQRDLLANAGCTDRLVAGDQDVLDERLRPLRDAVQQVDGGQAVVEARLDRHHRAVVAGVQVQRVDPVAVRRHLAREVRAPDPRLHRRDQLLAAAERGAFDRHRAHGRPRPFDDGDGAQHPHGGSGRPVRRQLCDARLDAHRRVAEPAVVLRDQVRGNLQLAHHQRRIRLDRQQRRQLRLGNGGVALERHAVDPVQAPPLGGEDERQALAVRLARVLHHRIAVAAVVQQGRDAPVGVLQQVLLDGALALDRHQRVEVGVRQRVAGQLDGDARPLPHVEHQLHEPAAVQHLDVVVETGLVEAAAVQLRLVVAQAALDVPAVVGHAPLQPEPIQDQRIHGRRHAAHGKAVDPHPAAGLHRRAQHAVSAAALDARLDGGRQEPALAVVAPQRLGDGRRLLRAEDGAVDGADGAAQIVRGYARPPVHLDALHELQRPQEVLQHDAAVAHEAADLDALEAAEAEQVRHALAHLPHGQRGADARLDQRQHRVVAQRAPVAHELDAGDGLADELVDPGGQRRRRGRQRKEKRKRNRPPRRAPPACTTAAIRGAHQNACLTRKSRA